jgi:hypothetical protein
MTDKREPDEIEIILSPEDVVKAMSLLGYNLGNYKYRSSWTCRNRISIRLRLKKEIIKKELK